MAWRVPAVDRLVVAEIGTNDWLGYTPGGAWRATEAGAFRAAYRSLLERVCTATRPALVCLGIWGPSGGVSAGGGELDVYDAVIAGECRAFEGTFVPLCDIYDDRRTRGPAGDRSAHGVADDVHPNDSGHRVIADRVLAALGSGGQRSPAQRGDHGEGLGGDLIGAEQIEATDTTAHRRLTS